MTEATSEPRKSNRGGKRPGAGRKPKAHVAGSALPAVDLAAAMAEPVPADIETAAQKHARIAVESLVRQMLHGKADAARIKAAEAVLDRGYGKPSMAPGGDMFLPFLANPTARQLSTEIRDEARRHANVAIEVLRRIATGSESESARVSAARSLLDRGLGMVAPAKLQDSAPRVDLGKKELAEQAAQAASTGLYATPPGPRTLQ